MNVLDAHFEIGYITVKQNRRLVANCHDLPFRDRWTRRFDVLDDHRATHEINGGARRDAHDAVAVDNRTTVMVFDTLGRRREEIISVIDLAHRIDANGGFRRCTWRQGTKHDLSARFALRRVVPAYDGGHGIEKREPVWLLIEWRDGEDEPANCFLCSLPERMTKKKLVRMVMQRWRTERAYQDLKDELGLDHYEDRRLPGWHHHVSVVLCCYAFVIAERVRHSPPPRPEGRWATTRSRSRPERHFADSFATMRLAIARAIASWLPRCPACHAPRRGERRPAPT
jgi:hypothetical protein